MLISPASIRHAWFQAQSYGKTVPNLQQVYWNMWVNTHNWILSPNNQYLAVKRTFTLLETKHYLPDREVGITKKIGMLNIANMKMEGDCDANVALINMFKIPHDNCGILFMEDLFHVGFYSGFVSNELKKSKCETVNNFFHNNKLANVETYVNM